MNIEMLKLCTNTFYYIDVDSLLNVVLFERENDSPPITYLVASDCWPAAVPSVVVHVVGGVFTVGV